MWPMVHWGAALLLLLAVSSFAGPSQAGAAKRVAVAGDIACDAVAQAQAQAQAGDGAWPATTTTTSASRRCAPAAMWTAGGV
jgi:hypothetical protein